MSLKNSKWVFKHAEFYTQQKTFEKVEEKNPPK